MFGIKSFCSKRFQIISNSKGLTRVFAYGELVCFPVSIAVILVVVGHSFLVLLTPLLVRNGIMVNIPPSLPSWFVLIFISAAIGYLTNYIAIQMLYYPVDVTDLANNGVICSKKDSSTMLPFDVLVKSRILYAITFGFWEKGLIPQNKEKVAQQMGIIAEENFITAENISYLFNKFGDLALSKNAQGKIRCMEFIRQLAVKNKDKIAELIQTISQECITGSNYQVVRSLLAKIGKSETVSDSLTMAIFDYMEKNPNSIVALIREMMAGFMKDRNRKAEKSGFVWEQFLTGTTNVIIDVIAEIGYPQIRNFLKEYAQNPVHREQFRNRLASLLPLFCDKMVEKLVSKPEMLEQFISSDMVSSLVCIDITSDSFWQTLSKKFVPEFRATIGSALSAIPKDQFTEFFAQNHHVSEMVKQTILRMKLLDFYAMLDRIMAEHLGAIQVFGFVLGGAIGYLQYAVNLVSQGYIFIALALFCVPIFFISVIKLVSSFMLVIKQKGKLNGIV